MLNKENFLEETYGLEERTQVVRALHFWVDRASVLRRRQGRRGLGR